MPALVLTLEIDDKGSIGKVGTLDKAFNTLTNNVKNRAGTIVSSMEQIQGPIRQIASQMRNLSIVGGLSFGAIGGLAFRAGVQFEQSMANVKAASGATSEELRKLEATARKYAQGTIFSAREVADAMRELARQGMKVGEIGPVIGKALLFAGATGMSLADTIQNLDNLMDVFGIAAENTGELVNTLTGAMSITPIDSLMSALSIAGPVAAEFDMSIKNLIIDFALLEKSGIAGTRAGSAYRLMLQQLIAPSKEVQALLGGVAFKGGNLREVLDQLRRSGAGATEIMAAFGSRGAGPILIKLMGASAEQIKKLEASLNDTSVAQKAYDDRMSTTQAKMTMFKNAVQEKMIDAFERLKPAIMTAIDAVKRAFDDMMPGIEKNIEGFGKFVDKHKDLIARVVADTPKVIALAIAFQGLAFAIEAATTAAKLFTFVAGSGAFGAVLAMIGSTTFLTGKMKGQLEDSAKESEHLSASLRIQAILLNQISRLNIYNLDTPPWNFIKARIADIEALNAAIENTPRSASKYASEFDVALAKLGAWNVERMAAQGTAPAPEIPATVGRFRMPAEVTPPTINWAAITAASESELRLEDYRTMAEEIKRIDAQMYDARRAGLMGTIAETKASEESWYEAKRALAEMDCAEQITREGTTAAQIMEARIACDSAVKEAELAHNEAVLQDWAAKHGMQIAMIRGLEAAWDTMVESALDKEMTGKQRREAIWESMKMGFLRTTSDMLKKWLVNQVKYMLLAKTAEEGINLTRKLAAAKLGAIQAYQAFAFIPFVGPALGAAAAAAAFAFLMAFHKGGFIGPEERIVKVQTEEFIMQRSAVRGIGRGNMEYMNATGRIPPSINTTPINLAFNISAGSADTADDLVTFIEDKIIPMLERAIPRGKFSLQGEH